MSDPNSMPFGRTIQYCRGCGGRHVSNEFHTVNAANRADFVARFPKFAESWSVIKPSTTVFLCCQWFKDGHNKRLHNFAEALVDREPLRLTAPTSLKRKSTANPNAVVEPDADADASKQRRVASRPTTPRMLFEFHSVLLRLLAF